MWLVPLSTLTLFPSSEYHQLSAGPNVAAVQSGAVPIPIFPGAPIQGVELVYQRLSESVDSSDEGIFDQRFTGNTETFTARISVDEQGLVQLDQLRADALLASIRIRRNLGDLFDLSLLGGHWESSWSLVDNGSFRVNALSPSNLTLVGLSNTDQDNDTKLKYYISIGTGIGGEFIGRLLGPIGVYGRAVGKATTQNRHQAEAKNHVRHEVHVEPSLGVAFIGPEGALLLTGWGEMTTQWETRDTDGRSGIDRQYAAWGLRLTGRLNAGEAIEEEEDIIRAAL